VHALRRESS